MQTLFAIIFGVFLGLIMAALAVIFTPKILGKN